MPPSPVAVSVVGVLGGEWFGRAAGEAIAAADVCIGAARHLARLPLDRGAPDRRPERLTLRPTLGDTIDLVAGRRAAGQRVCLLASGDPGFFGVVRMLAARFGPDALDVHPAPSSLSLAFARLGINWDDAAVVSAHGRPVAAAVEVVLAHPKVAVLTSPADPPEALGAALLEAGCGPRAVAVASRLGQPDEEVVRTDVDGLAAGAFDGLSVVVLLAPDGPADQPMGIAWGLPDDRFDHRAGMITKAEVRAVALGKLALPRAGVLWDVGAGSGSVAIECARLAPGLAVYAVERRADDVERLRANAAAGPPGAGLRVVEGEAPAALAALPDPDRAFVGGGGLDVLDAVLDRIRPGGVVVATYAALDRAAAAAARLGHLVQVSVSRGVPLGADGALRLAAENPVFVCWGCGAEGNRLQKSALSGVLLQPNSPVGDGGAPR